jgi:two-component system response regulator
MPEKTLLLVEDSPDDEDFIVHALRKERVPADVVVTRDGLEALEYLTKESNPLPCVAILDLKMPKIDGLELLRRLRALPRTRRLPIVIFTSSSEESDILRSYDLGACSYVRKPIDFDQFSLTVRRLGHYWVELNEPAARVEATARVPTT